MLGKRDIATIQPLRGRIRRRYEERGKPCLKLEAKERLVREARNFVRDFRQGELVNVVYDKPEFQHLGEKARQKGKDEKKIKSYKIDGIENQIKSLFGVDIIHVSWEQEKDINTPLKKSGKHGVPREWSERERKIIYYKLDEEFQSRKTPPIRPRHQLSAVFCELLDAWEGYVKDIGNFDCLSQKAALMGISWMTDFKIIADTLYLRTNSPEYVEKLDEFKKYISDLRKDFGFYYKNGKLPGRVHNLNDGLFKCIKSLVNDCHKVGSGFDV